MYRYLLMISLLSLMASCSIFSPPVKKEVYLINTLPVSIQKKSTRKVTLLVMPVQSRPVYNTTRMAYKIKPYQVNYFAKNEWAETPSQMFSTLLVRALQKNHSFRAIVTPPYAGRYDYLLNTEIIELQQDIIHQDFNLIVHVQLTKGSSQKVVASRFISVSIPLTEITPYGGVKAANKAAAKALRQMIKFCLDHV